MCAKEKIDFPSSPLSNFRFSISISIRSSIFFNETSKSIDQLQENSIRQLLFDLNQTDIEKNRREMDLSQSSLSTSPSSELRPIVRTRRDSDVSDDTTVQSTNDDASESKYSAVTMGYWKDPYIAYLVRRAERKSPEIHRGYYARVKAVRMVVDNFLRMFEDRSTQIVNLGCGFDTLFWQLKETADQGGAAARMPKMFLDVDFSTVTAKKIHHILKPSSPLRKGIVDGDDKVRELGHKCLYGPTYRLVGADIRDLGELNRQLTEAEIDFERPTLFIAECVLVYMTPEQGNGLIKYASERFARSYFLTYDPVNMKDKFGEIFKDNMYTRGLLLAGVEACGTIDTQMGRFRSNGWNDAQAWTLTDVYSKYLPKDEIQRIEHIEPLDEKELLDQLLDHYCIVMSRRDASLPALQFP